jgi:GT2 family glycosyltransferase
VTTPAVSVLIVAYRSGDTLPRCLDALRAQTVDELELVLADNSPEDPSARALADADPSIRYLDNGENIGFAAGNNRAAAVASGRRLALLNPDAFPEPDWLERLLAAADRLPDVRCFTSLQLDDRDPTRLDGAGDVMTAAGVGYRGGYRLPRSATPPEGQVFSPCGAAMMIDRELFLALGGFDERFFCYCEDIDLGWRLRLRGEPVVFVPDAVVRHVGGASSDGSRSPFALRYGARNRLWTFVKNTPPLLLFLTAPSHLAATLALAAVAVLRREPATLQGLADALAGLPSVLHDRAAVQRTRRRSSLQLAPLLVWNPLTAFRRGVRVAPLAQTGEPSHFGANDEP